MISPAPSALEVYVDIAGETLLAGAATFRYRGATTTTEFTYSQTYLQNRAAYALGPELPLARSAVVVEGLPACFADSTPDWWGRQLVAKRLRLETSLAGKPPVMLTDVDYLVGASDQARQGRFTSVASKLLESMSTRLLRRANGTKVRPLERKWFAERQAEWATAMAEDRRRRRLIDRIEGEQRNQMYDRRAHLADDASDVTVRAAIEEFASLLVHDEHTPGVLVARLASFYDTTVSASVVAGVDHDARTTIIEQDMLDAWRRQGDRYGNTVMAEAAKRTAITVLEAAWRHHLAALDRIIAAYYRRSPDGTASTMSLNASATEEFAQMWRDVSQRTVKALLGLHVDPA